MTATRKEVLRGKYEIVRRIGAGSMAAVFAGRHTGTDRPVAIKRLLPDQLSDPQAIARFEREARAAGRVQSAHVVEILDFDRDDDGAPFIVLERLVGESLFERSRREPKLPVPLALALARQILAGLADLHRAGVVHRDLKPANVFLVARDGGVPLVKLVDFGVSKLDSDADPRLTRMDETLGTPSFMPPEQIAKSTAVGPATDVWAAGVVLFRMLAGTNPFSAEDPTSLVARILEQPAPRLADVGVDPAVAAAVQPVVDRALEKDPRRRHPSADAMREHLEDATRALGIELGAGPARPPASVPPPPATPGTGQDAPTLEFGRRVEGRKVEEAAKSIPSAPKPSTALAVAIGAMAAIGVVAGWKAAGALGSDAAPLRVVAQLAPTAPAGAMSPPPPASAVPLEAATAPAQTAPAPASAPETTRPRRRGREPAGAAPTAAPSGPSRPPVIPVAPY